MASRILIVEDDPVVARLLSDAFAFEGFAVDHVADGVSAIRRAADFAPDIVVLDLVLPDLDGFEICRILTRRYARLRIVMLTARTQSEDTIRGLTAGADDYVTKPFALNELMARVRALLRRRDHVSHVLTCGAVSVDLRARRASRNDRLLNLTDREFGVLAYLVERQGHVVSRDELLQAVWGHAEPPITRTVDIMIARLRRKLERDSRRPHFIRTAHGGGYFLGDVETDPA